jgi:hypothetical protein
MSAGMAESEAVIARLQTLQRIIRRTIERRLERPFQDTGRPAKFISEGYEVFLSVPRGSDFAVILRLGRPDQPALPGLDYSAEVFGDILESLSLFNDGNEDALKEKMPDEAYYRNFVALARTLAPDGEDVKVVGFAVAQEGGERQVALTTPQQKTMAPSPRPHAVERGRPIVEGAGEPVVRVGRLRHASELDYPDGLIVLVDQQDNRYQVRVPEGMMADIVKPLWGETVEVEGVASGGIIYLHDIRRVDE